MVARRAHNPEVAGSSPAFATNVEYLLRFYTFPVAAIDTGTLIDKRGARAIARAEAYKEEP